MRVSRTVRSSLTSDHSRRVIHKENRKRIGREYYMKMRASILGDGATA